MNIFFMILFLQSFSTMFLIKTEIKFTLNVKSLFRCKKNGPVLSFDSFPSDQLFNQTIGNITKDCYLILLPVDKRIIFDIKELYLQCDFKWFRGRYLNEILVFQSNCSADNRHDRCQRFTPTNVLIITDILTPSNDRMTFETEVLGIGTEHIEIGDRSQYPFPFSRYETRGSRNFHLIFRNKLDEFLQMMCRYTFLNKPSENGEICQFPQAIVAQTSRTRSGPATREGKGWSWVCYYYPSGAENPVDYKIMERAQTESEKLKPKQLVKLSPNGNESNSVVECSDGFALPPEEKHGSSLPIISLLFVVAIASGIFCICKKTFQTNSTELDLTRLSTASGGSLASNESLEDINE